MRVEVNPEKTNRALAYEWMARTIFAGLLIINGWIFWKRVLPVYKESFSNEHEIQTASQTLF